MRVVASSSVVTAAVILSALACDRPTDAAVAEATIPDPAATTSAEPVASSSRASAQPMPSASGARRASASSSSSAVAHPLAEWMRGPATAALESGNLESIAGSFEQMAAWTPPEDYPNWRSISLDGSRAARAGDVEAVKAACRGCHAQYEARYKAQLPSRPLP